MTRRHNCAALIAAALALGLAVPSPAAAQVAVEADPLAYALNGYSLHLAGIAGGHRVSVGAFGIDVPRFLHDNDGWSASMRGAGLKWDPYGGQVAGMFVGVDANLFRMSYTYDAAAATVRRNELGVGVRGGYRLPVGRAGLYVAPWIGVGYTFRGGDVAIGDATFEHSALSIFPTVHIGWRF